MGGHSLEGRCRLFLGRHVLQLEGKDFEVLELDAGHDVVQRLSELQPDVVFNALHGRWGETVPFGGAGMAADPYTHSGVMASAFGYG